MANLSSYKSYVLSEEKESLKTTINVLKNESKEKEAKSIDKEIALEKKVKELDNIVYKMGQSAQTVHMLTKPYVFYDNNLKQALGFQNPFYLKKAQQIRPMLYDGTVIAKETNVISIADLKESLMLEEESRSKMILKQSGPMVFEKKVNIKPINYVELNRLMYKLDLVILAHEDKNNRKTHIHYLKHAMEQAAILREIVKQAKSLNPLDSESYYAYNYVKLIQDLLGYVRDSCLDIPKHSEKLVAVTPINKKKIVRKPDLSYLHVFGALCYPNNNSETLGQLQAKADTSIFIRYAPKKKAYRIYNRHTQKIIEIIHVDFDELSTMNHSASNQIALDNALVPPKASLILDGATEESNLLSHKEKQHICNTPKNHNAAEYYLGCYVIA
nr:retrovirus-related Pol polyprotein from transposon TNT 1-94 [Tanacetum cinerariifolium]